MSFNELFRKRQKLVLGLVAVIIIPSFVLVWGVGGSSMGGGGEGPTVAIINGQKLSQSAFFKFRRRLWAALGGLRLHYSEAPDENPQSREAPMLWSTAIAWGHIERAREEGFSVSVLEIDTSIRSKPWAKAAVKQAKADKEDEEKALKKAFKNTIKQLKLTKEEYRLGISEWLVLQKYLQISGELPMAAPGSAYYLYAQDRAKCLFKRVKILPDEGMKVAASKVVLGATGGETTEAEEKAWKERLQSFLESNRRNPEYSTRPKWRFEYALAPFDSRKHEIKEERLKKEFDNNKNEYKGKKFEDVKEEIRGKMLKEEQRSYAVRLIRQEIDTYITRHMNEKKPVVLAEMAKSAILVKLGIKTGVSGGTAMTVEEILKQSVFAEGTGLEAFLNRIALLDTEKQKTEIARFKSEFDSSKEIIATAVGMFRVRILEFVAPVAKQLDWQDTPESKAFREILTRDLLKEEVRRLVREKATALRKTIREGKAEGLKDFDLESISWSDAEKDLEELRILDVGETIERPFSKDGASGIEVLYLVERRVPSRSDYRNEPSEVRERFAKQATNSNHGSMQVPWWIGINHLLLVRPNPSVHTQMREDVNKERIRLFFDKNR